MFDFSGNMKLLPHPMFQKFDAYSCTYNPLLFVAMNVEP